MGAARGLGFSSISRVVLVSGDLGGFLLWASSSHSGESGFLAESRCH